TAAGRHTFFGILKERPTRPLRGAGRRGGTQFALRLGAEAPQLVPPFPGELLALLHPSTGPLQALLRPRGVAQAVMAHREKEEIKSVVRPLAQVEAPIQLGDGLAVTAVAIQGNAERVADERILGLPVRGPPRQL